MIRPALAPLLLASASAAVAQDVPQQGGASPMMFGSGDSRSPVAQGSTRTIYGAAASDKDGMVSLRIGSGGENDCGSGRWTMPRDHVVSIEEAGQCRAGGRLVTQYRVTYRSAAP
jgi:hypothetical protein